MARSPPSLVARRAGCLEGWGAGWRAASYDASREQFPIDRCEGFHRAIEALPRDLREASRMVCYLGLDRDSAAAAMGCSIRTLGRMWQEAREWVGEALEQAGD